MESAGYLLVLAARTYALIQALHAVDDRGPEGMRRLIERYGARLLEERGDPGSG